MRNIFNSIPSNWNHRENAWSQGHECMKHVYICTGISNLYIALNVCIALKCIKTVPFDDVAGKVWYVWCILGCRGSYAVLNELQKYATIELKIVLNDFLVQILQSVIWVIQTQLHDYMYFSSSNTINCSPNIVSTGSWPG